MVSRLMHRQGLPPICPYIFTKHEPVHHNSTENIRGEAPIGLFIYISRVNWKNRIWGPLVQILSKNKNQSNLISLPKVSWALRGRSGPDRPRCRPAGPAAAPLGTTSTRWRTQTLLAAWVRRVITWCMVYYHARRRSTYDVRIGNELMTTYISMTYKTIYIIDRHSGLILWRHLVVGGSGTRSRCFAAVATIVI
jgi:hypothetical protein